MNNKKNTIEIQNDFLGQHAAVLASTALENRFDSQNLGGLGINTKSKSKINEYFSEYFIEERELKFNEITQSNEVNLTQEDRQFLKYQRLAAAREVLYSKEKADAYKEELHRTQKNIRFDEKTQTLKKSYKRTNAQHRTFHCHYDLASMRLRKDEKASSIAEKDKSVDIYHNNETGKYFLKGNFLCSSVWTCPVCSAKITEKRKEEIKTAFEMHRINGGGKYEVKDQKRITHKETTSGIYMMTLTLPHSRHDDLKDLMKKIRLSVTYLKQHRKYKETLKSLDFIGEIRALEVTFSENNGWHPHFHSILFFNKTLSKRTLASLKEILLKIWQDGCLKNGLEKPNYENGLDIQDGSQAHKYINKWGLEHELTKWTSKTGKKSCSPFQLLDLYTDAPTKEKAFYYKKLFNEYAEAFHGFRQLYWSPGLKARFGIDEIADEELTQEEIDLQTAFIGSISLDEWKLLRRIKIKHKLTNTNLSMIFHITKIVRLYGYQELRDFINKMMFTHDPENMNLSEIADHLFYGLDN